jgi:hypothetical protein
MDLGRGWKMKVKSLGPHIVIPSIEESAEPSRESGGVVAPMLRTEGAEEGSSFRRSSEEALARLLSFVEKNKVQKKRARKARKKLGLAAYKKRTDFLKDLALLGSQVDFKI